MHLFERLRPELILIDPPVTDREALFASVAQAVAAVAPGVGPQEVTRALMDREAILSTGVGRGVAVPHGQVDGLEGLLVGASTHPGGIRYPSLDGEPVRLVFCLLGSPETAADHLACLARVARLARRADSLEPLVTASSAEEFLERLEALERGV